MSIRDWPAAERPREKLLERGASALSDAELLAIFLRTGVTGQSAVDLARQLLTDFDGLRPLLAADRKRFCAARGLGDAKFVQLQAVLEMARRHLSAELREQTRITDARSAFRFLRAQLAHRPHEVFCALFLDTRHRVIAFEELFRGTIDGASVYPREVVKTALGHNAAAVILAHNHPSGVAEPSSADRHLTGRLRDALALVEIRVLDHVIIGQGDPVSFAERGLL
ncbi:DNA repair protein RadC [uncultured Abyssibacter sp.]|uniref:RadC family protein n=1 Tax=uncultured Abyssibacter sp. TaxID=2320202 RepID=UPI0032B263FC